MKKNDSANEDDFITVIPCQRHDAFTEKRVIVQKLYFWHKGTFDHPINDQTIHQFLLHVKMFGATVFPDRPQLGCLSVTGDKNHQTGEAPVHQILYKGNIIYSRS